MSLFTVACLIAGIPLCAACFALLFDYMRDHFGPTGRGAD